VKGKGLPYLALLLLVVGSAGAQESRGDFIRAAHPEPLPKPLAAALAGLDTTHLTRHLAYLTDPRREGRGLGTRGLEATVQYLETQLKASGISPLGASHRQTVPMREVRPGTGTVRFRTGSGTFTFQAGRNAILPAIAPGTLSGPAIFVGYGIQEPALGHDDFCGYDVRGKVVVFLAGCPPGEAWQRPDLIEKYNSPRSADRYDARLALLEKLGAKAAIGLEEGLERRIAEGKEPSLPYFLAARGTPGSGEPPLARVALTGELRALATASETGTTKLSIRGRLRDIRSFNVIGKLTGSDPTLRGEAVLLGAHMDHLGMPNHVLHPGADDNASGMSALLEMARVLAASPSRPRRTLLFAFWTGEEEGKFGSGHYTRHPRWPLAATKAYLNLDMIGHPWTRADLDPRVRDEGARCLSRRD
jgi:hypothetical protein